MIVSSNELDGMVRKAFRGATYHWGEAEEAGKAAVWLARRNAPFLGDMLSLLREARDHLASMRPLGAGPVVRSGGKLLCPVLAGISLIDLAADMTHGARIEYRDLGFPSLFAPFVSRAEEIAGLRLELHETDGAAFVEQLPSSIATERAEARPLSLILQAVQPKTLDSHPTGGSSQMTVVDHSLWDELSRFAHLTYVPATHASRLFGAGAGVADND